MDGDPTWDAIKDRLPSLCRSFDDESLEVALAEALCQGVNLIYRSRRRVGSGFFGQTARLNSRTASGTATRAVTSPKRFRKPSTRIAFAAIDAILSE